MQAATSGLYREQTIVAFAFQTIVAFAFQTIVAFPKLF